MHTPKLKLRATRKLLVIGLSTAAVGALGGTAFAVETASVGSSDTTIHACVAKFGGIVRVVDADTTCSRGETALSWNQTGPAGPPGPTTTVTASPTDSSGGVGAGKGDSQSSGPTITFDQLDGATAVVAIDSASFGTSWSQGGGGAPQFSQLAVSKPVDSHSGALFDAATTDATLGNATLQVPSGNHGAALRVQLHDVRIVGFAAEGSGNGSEEQLELTFDDIFYNGGHYRFPPSNSPNAMAVTPTPTPSGWNLQQG